MRENGKVGRGSRKRDRESVKQGEERGRKEKKDERGIESRER